MLLLLGPHITGLLLLCDSDIPYIHLLCCVVLCCLFVQIAAAWRDVDASFPSAAGPQQPIKLPRQHNVDKEEYKEFLNLGHGEIFNLDLDRWVCDW